MNIFDLAMGGLSGAQGNLNQAASMFGSPGTVAEGMGTYFNPYTDEVINNTMNDVLRMASTMRADNAGAAARAGAFGGDRHGVVDALTNEGALRQMADAAGNLRHAGFTTAGQFAGQDVSNRLAGASGLAGAAGTGAGLGATAFNMGSAVSDQQQQQGNLMQLIQQQIMQDAQGNFQGFADQPLSLLAMRNAAASGSPLNAAVTQSQTSTPGLMDYLSLGAGVYSSALTGGKGGGK